MPAQYSAHRILHRCTEDSGFIPLPSLPTATLPGKSNPPQFALFRPLPGTTQPNQPRPTRPRVSVLFGAGPGAGPPRCRGAHSGCARFPIMRACPRSLASRGHLPGCRAPLASFPRQPDSSELNARSFADVAKPPSLPQGRRTARRPLEYPTRGVLARPSSVKHQGPEGRRPVTDRRCF